MGTKETHYERTKKKMNINYKKKGNHYVSSMARNKAIQILIRNHRIEFDKLVENLKEEISA